VDPVAWDIVDIHQKQAKVAAGDKENAIFFVCVTAEVMITVMELGLL